MSSAFSSCHHTLVGPLFSGAQQFGWVLFITGELSCCSDLIKVHKDKRLYMATYKKFPSPSLHLKVSYFFLKFGTWLSLSASPQQHEGKPHIRHTVAAVHREGRYSKSKQEQLENRIWLLFLTVMPRANNQKPIYLQGTQQFSPKRQMIICKHAYFSNNDELLITVPGPPWSVSD